MKRRCGEGALAVVVGWAVMEMISGVLIGCASSPKSQSATDAGSNSDTADAGGGSEFAKPGPYAVGHVIYKLLNPATGRTVPVNVFYPVDPGTITVSTPAAKYPLDSCANTLPVSSSANWEALGYDRGYEGSAPSGSGPFPLVMMSPGFGGDSSSYLFVSTRLATHGFVVAALAHCSESTSAFPVALLDRIQDTPFAMDQVLLKGSTDRELLKGTLDPSRIAVAGHSVGGYVAYALAGGDDEICDAVYGVHLAGDTVPYPPQTCVPALADARVKAIVSLDGTSPLVRYHELARISVPSLILGESVEPLRYNGGPSFESFNARPHAAIGRSDSYRISFGDAEHSSFSNWCDELRVMSGLGNGWASDALKSAPCAKDSSGFDPANDPTTHRTVTAYMVAFLKTHLGIADDSRVLTSDYAAQNFPRAEFFASEACNTPLPDPTYFTYRPHPSECAAAAQGPAVFFLTDAAASVPLAGFKIQPGGYVVAGQWSGYARPIGSTSGAADAGATTISPVDFSSVADGATELCVQGTVGPAIDAGAAASIAVNVNQARTTADAQALDAGLDAGMPPVQNGTTAGSGITVEYTNPGQSPLQLALWTNTNSARGTWCALLSGMGGTETLTWDTFFACGTDPAQQFAKYWVDMTLPPVGLSIVAVSIFAPGSTTAPVPYSFCLQGLAQAP
jgi:predicted dienelactone hydrolase